MPTLNWDEPRRPDGTCPDTHSYRLDAPCSTLVILHPARLSLSLSLSSPMSSTISLRSRIMAVCDGCPTGPTLRHLMKATGCTHSAMLLAVLRQLVREELLLPIQLKGRGQRVRWMRRAVRT